MEPNQGKKSYGALIGSVIIIVILVLGGIYFWMSNQEALMPQEETPMNENTQLNDEEQMVLDEMTNLEAELNQGSTNVEVDISTVE